MTSLARLIEKLEAASEGSRELDEEIAHAVGHAHSVMVEGAQDVVYSPPYPNGEPRCNPVRYTTSLDAALSLVPEGWFMQMRGPWPDGQAWYCEMASEPFIETAHEKVPMASHGAPTAALAVSTCSLKARAALAEEK